MYPAHSFERAEGTCAALRCGRAGSRLRDRDVLKGGSLWDTINTSHRLHWDAADPAVARRPAWLVGLMALHILGLTLQATATNLSRVQLAMQNPSHDFTY